jgi:hypothetical protein
VRREDAGSGGEENGKGERRKKEEGENFDGRIEHRRMKEEEGEKE